MSELKTKPNDASVDDFLDTIDDEKKQKDSRVLLDIYTRLTGKPAKMWGSSIIGFDMYHYKSERSSQEGDWPMVAFSPRKQNLTLYVMTGFTEFGDLLKDLGKHKTSVGCLYINKLADVDLKVLEKIITRAYEDMKKQYSS